MQAMSRFLQKFFGPKSFGRTVEYTAVAIAAALAALVVLNQL
jgi:hypothetical protein